MAVVLDDDMAEVESEDAVPNSARVFYNGHEPPSTFHTYRLFGM